DRRRLGIVGRARDRLDVERAVADNDVADQLRVRRRGADLRADVEVGDIGARRRVGEVDGEDALPFAAGRGPAVVELDEVQTHVVPAVRYRARVRPRPVSLVLLLCRV